jgi:hypothetical protein
VLTEPTHLPGISEVPSSSSTTTVAMPVIAGTSSSSPTGTEPPPKKTRSQAFLQVSSWYACGIACCLHNFSSSYPCS